MQIRWFFVLFVFYACSPAKQISKSAKNNVLNDPALKTAHVGISVFDPATGKYIYDYQGDKYFVPASNTKIPTCYAAMKYLGDSLVGLRYGFSDPFPTYTLMAVQPTGDPSVLHEDFKRQPVMDFLRSQKKRKELIWGWLDTVWRDDKWGNGWSWNDYDASYMAERSSMPVFGNVLEIKGITQTTGNILFKTQSGFFDSIINSDLEPYSARPDLSIGRSLDANEFTRLPSRSKFSSQSLPFVADGSKTASWIIADSLNISFEYLHSKPDGKTVFEVTCGSCPEKKAVIEKWHEIHSQPTDSLLKPMMHRSDNFFAEQSLLMVSNKLFGVMNDSKIIDSILKADFKDLPQKPRWVDGSGLSRYNLFTPQDFVAILNKMKNEFGMDRIKEILPTGNDGTLTNYYKTDSNFIYAKTGTLSGVVALSGFLYTKTNKLLIFSILVNNHNTSATQVRRAVERFVQKMRRNL
jgi:D-alanyl-D-alanine carboxypeptidase/D-alanyl-D-alanine-endopeptidase (penicillin-binding protein 4)